MRNVIKARGGRAIQELEHQPEIIDLDSSVRNYLKKNTPTLGHGYHHLKQVARTAYELAIDNDLTDPHIAYIVGFFHDIYRPAQGLGGKEPHEDICVQEATKILAKTKFSNETDKIVMAILNHDQAIIEGRGTKLMQVLSIADKIDMNFYRVVAYAWESNQYKLSQGQPAVYESLEKLRDDFCFYQQKANKIFKRVEIVGLEKAINAYRQTNEQLNIAVQEEKEGKIKWGYSAEGIAISLKSFDPLKLSERTES